MTEFFPEIEVSQDQAEAMARGLYAVARADGQVHEREAALISEFFASTGKGPAELGSLERAPTIEGSTLALALPTAELRRLFIKTSLLVALADGVLGESEARVVYGYGATLALTHADLALLETQVKEFLLAQLSQLHNTAATAEVARELKV